MAIDKANIENIYPLTPMQQGMLFHALLEPRSQAYFEQLSWRVHGELDVEALQYAWNALVERHASLRTLFAHEGSDEPLQVVLKSRPIAIDLRDLRGMDGESGVARYKAADRARPFTLARDPLLRVAVLRLADDRFEIVWSHHHIILDGWSVGLALAELLDIYRARRNATNAVLPPVTPFARFVKWLQGRDHAAASRFWAARIHGCAERITIPHGRGGIPSDTAERGTLSFALGLDVTAGLQALAARRGVTLAVVLQSIWALLLGRYADTGDVVFGSVVSGRTPEVAGVDQVVGNFINTVPVRARLDRADTFDDLVAAMQRDAADAAPHQHAALSRVQSTHRLEEGLFGTLVSFANYPRDPRLTGDAGLPDLGFVVDAVTHIEQTHYDVDVQFVPVADLQVRITYARRLYDAATMATLEGCFHAAARTIATHAGVRLDEIELLGADEHSASLAALGEAQRPPSATLVGAFERQVSLTPRRIAVTSGDDALTYDALNGGANMLAHRLRAVAAIEHDSVVAVLVGRDTNVAVALLGVLKAGAAYLPLEASLPRERLAYIIENAGCRAVVAQRSTREAVPAAVRVPVVDLDAAPEAPMHDPQVPIRASDLAYVIYTSGSTGLPKGVMIEHQSVVNLVAGLREHVYERYEPGLRVALLASYGFDASVQQIFAALLLGHTLVVVDDSTRRDGAVLNRFLCDRRIDVMDGTPTLLQVMARSPGFDEVCRCVRHALIGGEPLPWTLAEEVLRRGGMLVSNVYGPTECCVDATAHLVIRAGAHEGPSVPVGRPLANVRVLVLGRTGHISPRGARGEICIAGPGVGRGYLRDAALTDAKFVRPAALGGVRLFRTADMGRVLADGTLECLGRFDDQVKVRGYRIEIGEIEHHLAAHPGVEQCAVFVARGAQGEELRASLVLSHTVHVDELRAHLGEALPGHMIPSRFVRLASLPRTDSGKLDRKRLAAEQAGEVLEVGSDYAPPESDVERALAAAWQAALGIARVGIDDSYFSLGGDSIKAIQILSRLARQGLRLEIRDLFAHRTIRSLAPFVLRSEPAAEPRGKSGGPPALTAAQARFFAEHDGVEPGWFHHAVVFDARGRLAPTIVATAFAAVRDRHDALRFAFSPQPRVLPRGAAPPEVSVTRNLQAALPALLASFDLAGGSLHRLAIVRAGERDRLVLVVHHLCIDGVSWRILAEDLALALAASSAGREPDWSAPTEAPLAIALRLGEYGRSEAARGQLAYWRDVEARAALLLEPAGTRAARHRDRAAIETALGEDATRALLVAAHRAYGTTTEDLLLTAFARALHARFGATATGITLESHGRSPAWVGDSSRTLGWFTSLYPFVLSLDPARDLAFQVKSTKEAIRAVPDRGLAYGVLRYLGGAPLTARPQVSFNYLGDVGAADADQIVRMSAEPIAGGVSPDAPMLAELEAAAIAIEGRLRVMLAFNVRRFTADAMRGLLDAWRGEIGAVLDHCRSRSGTELTPADLTYSQLTVDELEGLFK